MKRKRTAMSYNETLAKDMYGRRPAHLSSIQRLNAVGAVYGPESADHGRNCSSVISNLLMARQTFSRTVG